MPNYFPYFCLWFLFTIYKTLWVVSNHPPTPRHLRSSSWVPDGILLPTNHLYLDTLQIPQDTWWKLKCWSHYYSLYISQTCSLPEFSLLLDPPSTPLSRAALYNFLESSVAFTLTGQSPSPDNLLLTFLHSHCHYFTASFHCFTLWLLQQLLNCLPIFMEPSSE